MSEKDEAIQKFQGEIREILAGDFIDFAGERVDPNTSYAMAMVATRAASIISINEGQPLWEILGALAGSAMMAQDLRSMFLAMMN